MQLTAEQDKVKDSAADGIMRPVTSPTPHRMSQVANLLQREAVLKEHAAQLDKKLNDMQRVYMKGVKSTVESIRAGRAVLGGHADGGA
jgi:hypothetical protein